MSCIIEFYIKWNLFWTDVDRNELSCQRFKQNSNTKICRNSSSILW